jgi:hypothetical protein
LENTTVQPTREFINRPKELWALIRSKTTSNSAIAMFVHGFRGNYLNTWGKIPDLLWEKADSDPATRNWDFLFLGYSTFNIATYLDIASLICGEWKKCAKGEYPYGRKYERLALFGHSLGTLGIRQALCANAVHNGSLLAQLHNVTLFGTPLNGSPLALTAPFYKIADALKPANPQLRMLRTWVEGSLKQNPWPPVRLVLGQGDWVVGQQFNELIQWPGDQVADQAVLDHGDMVKPDTWTNSLAMDYLRNTLL